MQTTRRHLDAENKALRARLAACELGESRKALNARVKKAEGELKAASEKIAYVARLEADLLKVRGEVARLTTELAESERVNKELSVALRDEGAA